VFIALAAHTVYAASRAGTADQLHDEVIGAPAARTA
jgi:hypothetical protein